MTEVLSILESNVNQYGAKDTLKASEDFESKQNRPLIFKLQQEILKNSVISA